MLAAFLTTSTRTNDTEANSLIGVVLAICGNILISFALNIQKLAHNRLSDEKSGYHGYGARLSSSRHKLNPSARQDDVANATYLHSKIWWLGIFLMVLGEIGNFMAYGFAPASTIAPLGITTLVFNAVLAPVMLNEAFRKQDLCGIALAVLGAAGVVSNTKSHEVKLSPELVAEALLQTRSMVFYGITCVLIILLTGFSSEFGGESIFIDVGLVALYGGYTVIATKGLSSLLSMTLYKLFTYTVSYVLIIVLIFTAIMQVKYLNSAMQRFDAIAVIPTQFVLFTISAITGGAVIYHDFDGGDVYQLTSFVIACLTEFIGIFLITSNRHSHPSNDDDVRRKRVHNNFEEEAAPLLSDAGDSPRHHQQIARQSSLFCGISLHSQLAGMSDDDRTNALSDAHHVPS